jgi:2-succinyl-5-enolpyruvyl-6-hydroxy-3-cyclohexene-1-carboxylate synthase
MPVRDLEWYAAPRDGVDVLSNRGANGIDGVVSTAVGAALTGAPTALLIGDVAFLHDSNGLLGIMRRDVNLTVVVIDNDGGGIFSFLPQRGQLDAARFEQLFGTPHGVDITALAAAHGVPSERVATRTGVQAALAGALTRGGPRVVVVDTDRDANVAVHAELHAAIAAAWDESSPQR